MPAQNTNANNTNKEVIFKNCAPFTDCMSKINNTQVDNAKDIHIVMLMYNLIEYSNNYSETCGSLWQYCRDEPPITAANTIKYSPVLIIVNCWNLSKK